jgi:hypothetical protein
MLNLTINTAMVFGYMLNLTINTAMVFGYMLNLTKNFIFYCAQKCPKGAPPKTWWSSQFFKLSRSFWTDKNSHASSVYLFEDGIFGTI